MQLYPLKLIPTSTSFDFIKLSKISYAASILASIVCIVYICLYGFNFGIDFIGGISMEVRTDKTIELQKIRNILNKLEIGEVVVQNFGTNNDLSVRVGSNSEERLVQNIALIKQTLNEELPCKLDYRKVDFVGPQIGNQLIKSGIIALVLSFAAIMIYIWIRFEWYFGMGVLIALIHDAILALGLMSIARLDFNLSTIAALLTIIGYSVNDSVVIYDRIRENLRKFSKKSMTEIINISVNETLSRTTLTVLTTLLADLALIIFGGDAIHSFSILVFFGIIAGTYSSIFISAPILIIFKTLSDRKSN